MSAEPDALPLGVDTSETYEFDKWRNRVAARLANAALRLATDDYRKFVGGAILYGMSAAARDAAGGLGLPPDIRQGRKP